MYHVLPIVAAKFWWLYTVLVVNVVMARTHPWTVQCKYVKDVHALCYSNLLFKHR